MQLSGDELRSQARENIREAVSLILDANRVLAQEAIGDAEVIRERLKVSG